MGSENLKILILEDDDQDFALAEAILKNIKDWQCEVVRFNDAAEALAGIPQTSGQIIFLDYRLPGRLTGRDVLRGLREAGDQRPVIALTGQGDIRTATDFVREGAADYILKTELTAATIRRSIAIALTDAHLRKKNLALESELREAQKMEGVLTLAGGIAHDFNNMLMSITGNIELAKLRSTEPEVQERLDRTRIICEQMGETVRKLQGFRPGGIHQFDELELVKVLEKLRPVLHALAGDDIRTNIETEEKSLRIEGAEVALRQIIESLVQNAIEAMPDGGELQLHARHLPAAEASRYPQLSDQDYVVLEIRDTGRGIEEDIQSRIFDPFFSTKERGSIRGTGLSLAVVWQYARECNGFVDFESETGKGTVFRVYFPRLMEPHERRSDAALVKHSSGGEQTILVADDESMVLDATAAMIEHLGYRVLRARDGVEALDLFRRHTDEIDAVLLDISMPQMDGIRCFSEIRRIDPEARVVFITAYGAANYADRLGAEGALGVLDKPIDLKVLENWLKTAVERGSS